MLIKTILSLIVLTIVFLLLALNNFIFTKDKETAVSFKKAKLQKKKKKLGGDEELDFLEKLRILTNELLRKSEKDKNYFYKLVAIFFLIGFFAGYIFFSSFFLAVSFGVSFMPISLLYLLIKTQEVTRRELDELENAMSMITNSYIATNNILKSFEEYINELDKNVPKELRSITPFHEFVSEVIFYNPNIDSALIRLKQKISNYYFRDWIDKLRLCNNDSKMKFSLKTTIDAMNEVKILQNESDFGMRKSWATYFSTVGITFSVLLVFKFANKDWYYYLIYTFGGKFLIFLMLIVALISSIYVAKLNKPISTI